MVGPYVNDEYGDVYSAIYAFSGDDFSYAELKRVAESTRKRLLRVADVEKVDLVGDQDERIYIEFSTTSLPISVFRLKRSLIASKNKMP